MGNPVILCRKILGPCVNFTVIGLLIFRSSLVKNRMRSFNFPVPVLGQVANHRLDIYNRCGKPCKQRRLALALAQILRLPNFASLGGLYPRRGSVDITPFLESADLICFLKKKSYFSFPMVIIKLQNVWNETTFFLDYGSNSLLAIFTPSVAHRKFGAAL